MIENQTSSQVENRKSSKMSRFDQKIFMLRFNFSDSFDLKYESNIDEAEEINNEENFIEKKNVEKKNNENEIIEKDKSEKKNIENEFEFNVFDDNSNNEIEIEFNVTNEIETEINVLNVNVLNENNSNENEFDLNSFNVVESNVKNEIKKMTVTSLQEIFEYDSKEEQLNVVHTLRVKKQDVMLIAKTEYEKSMIFHFISLFKFNSITLMIMSLNAFEKDQVSIIARLENVNNLVCDRSCVYNSKMSSSRMLKEIKMKCYTHVLISSKMIIQNAIFKEMLQNSSFQERLNLIIVDETHLIFQ
jgi:hypothetical protein